MMRQHAISLVMCVALATVTSRAVPTAAESPTRAMPGDARPAGTVTVLAAASLTSAFQAVARAFEEAEPRVDVRFGFAGSSNLVQQIKEGALADVFAAADDLTMERVVAAGAAEGAPQVFARNRLAIVVPAGNPQHITGLSDLVRPGLVVALCAPAVPAGRYALEAFQRAGIAVPDTSREIDVRAAVTKVSLGEADVGIVYVTDARAAAGAVESIAILPPHNVIARYPIVALKEAPNPAAARAFVAFVLSTDGRRVLGDFGFLDP